MPLSQHHVTIEHIPAAKCCLTLFGTHVRCWLHLCMLGSGFSRNQARWLLVAIDDGQNCNCSQTAFSWSARRLLKGFVSQMPPQLISTAFHGTHDVPAPLCIKTDLELHAAGMQFGQLFRICRENFIVSNDMALRSHLNEFKDHQLLYTECASLSAPLTHV